MPSLSEHQSGQTTKLLFLGDSGTGKTGAICSLIIDGYRLGAIDFDNGLDVVVQSLRPGRPPYNLTPEQSADCFARVKYVTCTDKMRVAGVNMIPTEANAWKKAIDHLSKFEDWGPVHTWGPKDILLIDSLNFAGRAAMRLIMKLNNRLGQAPYQSDYLEAQRLVDNLLAMLYSDDIKCNVIVNSHIKEVGRVEDRTDSKGNVVKYTDPNTLKAFAETGTGKALSPTVGRSFNTILQADLMGTGPATKRIIRTQPNGLLALKSPIPKGLPATLPIETGLSTFFKAVRDE